MLAIPNTTTTARYEDVGAAVFPVAESGALTPYASGYLYVANAPAFVSVLKGKSQGSAAWSNESPLQAALLPLSVDRLAPNPDWIFGLRARDFVAGAHAQIFGALYQPGEVALVPSNQFSGTVSPSGSFTPANPTGMELITEIDLSLVVTFSVIPQTFKHLRIEGIARCAAAGIDQGINLNFNADAGANYDEGLIIGQNSAPAAFSAINVVAPLCGQITGAGSPAGAFGAFTIDIPYYARTANRKSYIAESHSPTGAVASIITGTYGGTWKNLAAINAITFGAGNFAFAFVAGSFASLYGIP